MPRLSADYTQFCIAGLQESSPEETNMHKNSCQWGFAPHPTVELTAPSDDRRLTALSLRTHPGSAIQVSSLPYSRNVDFVPTPLANITCSQTVCTNRWFFPSEAAVNRNFVCDTGTGLCMHQIQGTVHRRSHIISHKASGFRSTPTLLVPTASSWLSLWHFHQETRPISIQKIHASPPPHLHQLLIYRSISRIWHGMLCLATHSPISPYSVGLYADLPRCLPGNCTGKTGETHGRRESRWILAAGLHTATPDIGTSSLHTWHRYTISAH